MRWDEPPRRVAGGDPEVRARRQPIDTRRILRELGVAPPPDPIVRLLEAFLGIRRFKRICAENGVTATNADVPKQIDDVLATVGIGWELEDLSGSVGPPATGPLIFYGNHPYGFADALIALRIALARRPDTKVLANAALTAFDFNAAHVLWVDLGSAASRPSTNRQSLRDALRHLRSGGALLIFPSQVCSHLRLPACRVTDPPWTPHLLRLVDRTRAACVPLHFAGRNSWRFQLLGLIHPVFRTLLLLREFLGLKGRRIRVRFGATLPASEWVGESVAERMRRLRDSVYAMGRIT